MVPRQSLWLQETMQGPQFLIHVIENPSEGFRMLDFGERPNLRLSVGRRGHLAHLFPRA